MLAVMEDLRFFEFFSGYLYYIFTYLTIETCISFIHTNKYVSTNVQITEVDYNPGSI